MKLKGEPVAGAPVADLRVAPSLDAHNATHRRILKQVLAINVAQAILVGGVGVAAASTGLMGAGLDNLADGAVYAVSLYAVGRPKQAEARAATLSGLLLLALSAGLVGEVARRFLSGAEPQGVVMILVALANAATNLLVMRLLRAHREDGVSFRASWIFTGNDTIANLGIVASGVAVMLFRSPLPDLLIGLVVAGIAAKGGWEILRDARKART